MIIPNILFSQEYIISFTGSGESTTVESVKVENLNQGTTAVVSDGGSLYLKGTATGIVSSTTQTEGISVYPNPMQSECNVQFTATSSGVYKIGLYSLSGKQIANELFDLTEGECIFDVKNIPEGIWILNVLSSDCSYNQKIISKNISGGFPLIELVSNSGSTQKILKYSTQSNLKAESTNDVEMEYTTGDLLKLTGTSGNYCTVKTIIPSKDSTMNFEFMECTDVDGNNYSVVSIGTQIWMAENIRVTRYTDGTAIPLITDNDAWDALDNNNTDKAYCWYDNDSISYFQTYGALYTYAAAVNGDSRGSNVQGVCPDGWHLPNEDEWTTLENYISDNGHEGSEGTALKTSSGWIMKAMVLMIMVLLPYLVAIATSLARFSVQNTMAIGGVVLRI